MQQRMRGKGTESGVRAYRAERGASSLADVLLAQTAPPVLTATFAPSNPARDFWKEPLPVDGLKETIHRERIEIQDGKPVHLDDPL